MMFLQFFGSAILGGSLTAVGLAIAGYLGRAQLAHWLNKDIERVKSNYQKELEAEKAQFQQDLEAYKVSLIAQAERAKAAQEVKRTSALKILEMEFETLRQLHRATLGYGIAVSTAAAFLKQYRSQPQFNELHTRYKELEAAIYSIAIFLTPAELAILRRYDTAIVRVFPYCVPEEDPIGNEELNPLRKEMLEAEIAVDAWIAGRLKNLRSLD
ncbi:hypothetical protein [Variovorax guangxiensis]|uniref:Uncharacterized protein n=1 Tax=Variovorax guangxiensis TaxID=1775474 RepID=A0A840F9M1_9BURK|nr:hypothetical protein [Variovorax guangxiensis]MBB4219396.1 hypothetical protein [Variovorax guangxiensis]